MKNLENYQPQPNIIFSIDVRFNPKLNFGEKVFLAEMQSMTKEKGRYPFSARELGDLFGVSHQTIANWVKKLVKMGLVDIMMDYANEEHKKFLITK